MNLSPGGLALSPALLLWIVMTAAQAGEIGVEDCSACHAAISREWRTSLHAEAYTSPGFRKKLAETAAAGNSSCACHAPSALPPGSLGKEPVLRAEDHESGVDCLACHMDSTLVAWSSGQERYVPHWIRQEPIYSSGAFCTGCHARGRGSDFDCQTCHMSLTEGGGSDGPRIGKTAGATHKSHRWEGSRDPELLSGAAALEALREGENLEITVSSLLAAHYFPQSSHRRLRVAALGGDEEISVWEADLRLAPDSTAQFSCAMPENMSRVRIELRFYPIPEILPDSFFVLQRKTLE